MASVLDVILGGLFGRKPQAAPKPGGATAAPTPTPRPGETTSFQPPAQSVDVEAHLDSLAAKSDQKLNWRSSIVDLMKLLDIDSSLQNRKELARELGYTGDTGDSAAMNIWLHKQVMTRVVANGGKVPANLTD
jgi:hypothetical protein